MSIPGEPGRGCTAFNGLALEISGHFHHTLLVEAITEAHPGSRGEHTDSPFCFGSGKVFEEHVGLDYC